VQDSGGASALALVALADGSSGLSIVSAPVGLTSVVASNNVPATPATPVVGAPALRVSPITYSGDSTEKLSSDRSAALALVLEVSGRWDSVETPARAVSASPVPVKDDPSSSLNEVLGNLAVGGPADSAWVLSSQAVVWQEPAGPTPAFLPTGTAPAVERPKLDRPRLSWSQAVGVFFLGTVLSWVWHRFPTSPRLPDPDRE
jgi:hypothetical protein